MQQIGAGDCAEKCDVLAVCLIEYNEKIQAVLHNFLSTKLRFILIHHKACCLDKLVSVKKEKDM